MKNFVPPVYEKKNAKTRWPNSVDLSKFQSCRPTVEASSIYRVLQRSRQVGKLAALCTVFWWMNRSSIHPASILPISAPPLFAHSLSSRIEPLDTRKSAQTSLERLDLGGQRFAFHSEATPRMGHRNTIHPMHHPFFHAGIPSILVAIPPIAQETGKLTTYTSGDMHPSGPISLVQLHLSLFACLPPVETNQSTEVTETLGVHATPHGSACGWVSNATAAPAASASAPSQQGGGYFFVWRDDKVLEGGAGKHR